MRYIIISQTTKTGGEENKDKRNSYSNSGGVKRKYY